MDTKAHYTLVGLFVILLCIGSIAGILWLSVGLNRPVYHTFLTYIDQSVSGLNTEAPVKFNGVTVGYVKNITLNPTNPQQVIATLEITEGTPITTSTVATLTPQGITGIAFISLSAKTPHAPLVKVANQPPYPTIPSQPSLLVQLGSLLKDTSNQVQGISDSIQNILDRENAENTKAILINLNSISTNLAANSASINKILQDSQTIMDNGAEASKNLPGMVSTLSQSLTDLNQLTNLAKQNLMPAGQLLAQLSTLSNNILAFSSEIKQNPAILIRGKANNNLGPGE